jgi:hypothetical protein
MAADDGRTVDVAMSSVRQKFESSGHGAPPHESGGGGGGGDGGDGGAGGAACRLIQVDQRPCEKQEKQDWRKERNRSAVFFHFENQRKRKGKKKIICLALYNKADAPKTSARAVNKREVKKTKFRSPECPARKSLCTHTDAPQNQQTNTTIVQQGKTVSCVPPGTTPPTLTLVTVNSSNPHESSIEKATQPVALQHSSAALDGVPFHPFTELSMWCWSPIVLTDDALLLSYAFIAGVPFGHSGPVGGGGGGVGRVGGGVQSGGSNVNLSAPV